MNRKHFLVIVVALALMLAAAALLLRSQRSAWTSSDTRLGQKLLPELKLESVASIAIQDARATTTLVRHDAGWTVQQRADFPAAGERVRDLLLKLVELKIVQTEAVGASQLGRLQLVQPGAKDAQADAQGTRVDLKDAGGKTLAQVLLGKKVAATMAGAATGPQEGTPTGRYATSGDSGKESPAVFLVSDPLAQADPKPQAWLAKDLARVERAKSIVATAPDGKQRFAISRNSEASEWKLAGAGKWDLQRVQDVASALYGMQLVDVVADPKLAAIEHPVVVKAQTFDDLTYTFKIDDKTDAGNNRIAISVAGEPPAARTPAKGETAEEKAKQDKLFAEQHARLVERLARERSLERWTYLVSRPSIDALLRERAQLLPEQKAAKKP